MIHKLTTAILLCSALFALPAFGGPGHGHSHGPVSSEVASEKATEKLAQFVEAGKIDATWADVKPTSVEQKKYPQGLEWMITFNNDKVSDVTKKTVYMFFSLDGQYIATNYTGK